jgi:hypothetical protein
VYGRPGWKLDSGATGGLQKSSLDELVQGGPEIVERDRLRVGGGERVVVGRGEGGVEETRLGARELEIRLADRAQPAACAGWSAPSRAHSAHPIGHALSQPSHRCVADRRQERVAVGEMPVGGVGHHTHHAGRFTEHHGVRAAGPGQFQSRGDQAVANGSAGSAPPLCLTYLPR